MNRIVRSTWFYTLILFVVSAATFAAYYARDPAHAAFIENYSRANGWFSWADQNQYVDECRQFRDFALDSQSFFYPPLYSFLHTLVGCGALAFAVLDGLLFFASFALVATITEILTSSRLIGFATALGSTLLSNVWSQEVMPWSSNLSLPLLLAFLALAFLSNTKYFKRFGPILIALQYLTRPLDAAIMGVGYLIVFISREKPNWFRALLKTPSHYVALAIFAANYLFNYLVFEQITSNYERFQEGLRLDLKNIVMKSVTTLLNPSAMYPADAGYAIASLNLVFAIYVFVVVFVSRTRIRGWAWLPIVLYAFYCAFNGFFSSALLDVNMIHYFKSTFLISYIFLISAIVLIWREKKTAHYRTAVLGTIAWVAFIFANLGTPISTAIGPWAVMKKGPPSTLTLQIPEPGCQSSTCVIQIEGLYSGTQNAFYDDLVLTSGPISMRHFIDYQSIELTRLYNGLTLITHRDLPAGTYSFTTSDKLVTAGEQHLVLIQEVHTTFWRWTHGLFRRW